MNTLQARDLEILQFIAKFGYCQERQIAKLCDLSEVQTARIIKRLSESNCLNKIKVLANIGAYLLLTKESGNFLEVKPIVKPSLNTLNHDTLLIDLYFYLKDMLNLEHNQIKTDKQIRKNLGIHEKNGQLRIPDLLINDSIAIELEISEKPKAKLQEIVNNYIIDDNMQRVCYFLKSKTLLSKIHELTLNSPKFKFFLFEFDDTKKEFMQISEYINNEFAIANFNNLLDITQQPIKKFGNFEF